MSTKVVVVTGASRGIGKHVAEAFEQHGLTVERGSSAVAPLQDPPALMTWLESILDRHGQISVLVNNAGILDADVDVFTADPQEWWRTYEVNVRGTFVLSQIVGRHMIAEGGGHIVNLNSGRSLRACETASAYPGTKTAVSRLTGSMHLAGWERGLRVLDLMPGVVRTDLATSLVANAGRTEWTDPQAVTDLALAFAAGEIDELSGRMVDAMVDTPASLKARIADGLQPLGRTLGLHDWDYVGQNRAER